MIYASEDAKFGLTEVNIGLVPGWGGAIRLPRKITVNKAKEMILLGERITAQEAATQGIVNRVFPKETLFDEVDQIVDKLVAKPPLAIRGIKAIVSNGIVDGNVEVAHEIEHKLSVWLMSTHDFQEAVDAFREKRPAKFEGR
jgi:enoyl-CoA hydratase/carnithine racemase